MKGRTAALDRAQVVVECSGEPIESYGEQIEPELWNCATAQGIHHLATTN
ncbi:hypothetical protein C791_2241 [Amycolatopsis azurea DSM 43854]|uniref:Uncharacterized protein n=1 Tax=Amycolatopsis azurea DSM 43854 TaxID=1238180 RepID=M2NXA6_9PSEU|nr:hypothetical protein C791_2241 [Amycolatopsis azurea DSM 43854]